MATQPTPPVVRPKLRRSRELPPLLPVVAVGAGLIGIVLQLALPRHAVLPEVSPVRMRPMPVIKAYQSPPVDPLIGTNTLFSPTRSLDTPATVAANAMPPNPFDGATLVGVARTRRIAIAVVKRSTGELVQLHLGEYLGEWRLAAVLADGARFGRKGKVYPLKVGESAHVASPKDAAAAARPGVAVSGGSSTPEAAPPS